MAVVPPQRSNAEQRRMAIGIAVTTAIGVIMVGVVGPIVAAILIGAIWGKWPVH